MMLRHDALCYLLGNNREIYLYMLVIIGCILIYFLFMFIPYYYTKQATVDGEERSKQWKNNSYT